MVRSSPAGLSFPTSTRSAIPRGAAAGLWCVTRAWTTTRMPSIMCCGHFWKRCGSTSRPVGQQSRRLPQRPRPEPLQVPNHVARNFGVNQASHCADGQRPLGPRPAMGHEDQFRPPSRNGRCWLDEATFAWMGQGGRCAESGNYPVDKANRLPR